MKESLFCWVLRMRTKVVTVSVRVDYEMFMLHLLQEKPEKISKCIISV
jgi:hypothetical protein